VRFVTSWTSELEDDRGRVASEPALQKKAEALVNSALRALGRALSSKDSLDQLRAELLLEVARAMRRDARSGSWSRLPTGDRTKLREALLLLETLAESGEPLPLA
jgi:hypothetical protein